MSGTMTPNDTPNADARFDAGMRVRRAVLGNEHVDRAISSQTAFDAPFQRFITEVAWGSLWARGGLDTRTRSLITVALLAALGRREELEVHLRATRNTGATPEEIREALLHVAVYAGIPAANSAFGLARSILAAEDESSDQHGPGGAP